MTTRSKVPSNRKLLVLVIATVSTVILVGCSGSSTPKQATKDSGTVVLTEPGDNPGDIALRRQLAAAFMKLHPGVKVQILVVPATNYDQKIQTMIAGGKPPDIFGSGDVQIPNIVSKNFALDLAPLVKRDNYSLSDFYPQVVDGLTYDKKLVGLTDNWDTQVMYYNASLFKKAGIAAPTVSWTWDNFLAAANKLTSGTGTRKTYGGLFENWFAAYFDQMWAWGGDPFPNKGTECGYDSSQALSAFNSIVSLYKPGVADTFAVLRPGRRATVPQRPRGYVHRCRPVGRLRPARREALRLEGRPDSYRSFWARELFSPFDVRHRPDES